MNFKKNNDEKQSLPQPRPPTAQRQENLNLKPQQPAPAQVQPARPPGETHTAQVLPQLRPPTTQTQPNLKPQQPAPAQVLPQLRPLTAQTQPNLKPQQPAPAQVQSARPPGETHTAQVLPQLRPPTAQTQPNLKPQQPAPAQVQPARPQREAHAPQVLPQPRPPTAQKQQNLKPQQPEEAHTTQVSKGVDQKQPKVTLKQTSPESQQQKQPKVTLKQTSPESQQQKQPKVTLKQSSAESQQQKQPKATLKQTSAESQQQKQPKATLKQTSAESQQQKQPQKHQEHPGKMDKRRVYRRHYNDDFHWFYCSSLQMHFIDGLILSIVVITQLELLNYFIIHFAKTYKMYYYLLIIPDSISIVLYVKALCRSYSFLSDFYEKGKFSRHFKRYSTFQSTFGVMPLCYISWTYYAIVVIIKLGIIFKTPILHRITRQTHDFIGPQLLNVTVGISSFVFLLLAEGHNWTKMEPARNNYVTQVCYQTGIDLIDSCSLLGSVFYHPIHSSLEDGVLILVFLNFFLPAMKLYRLSLADMSLNRIDQIAIMMYVILYMMLITIPSIFIRMHLWLHYHEDASLFLLKNFLDIVITCRSVIPSMISLYKKGVIE